MAVAGRHGDEAGDGDVVGDVDLLLQRVEPVGVDAHHGGPGAHRRQRPRGAAPTATHVVAVHGPGEDDVGGGVEPAGELAGLVVEVGLHRVTTARTGVLTRLRLATEPAVHLLTGAVGDLGDPARHAQAVDGALAAGVVIVAAEPRRVGGDGRQLRGTPGDLVPAGGGGAGQDDEGAHPVGVGDGPLQGPHASHGAPDDERPALHGEGVGEGALGRDLVPDRDGGEPAPPRPTVRTGATGTGRALAATQDVRGDHEPARGVQGETVADDAGPPPRRRVPLPRRPDHVGVAGEGVQDEDGVVDGPVGREARGAPRLVRHPYLRDDRTVLGPQVADVDERATADRVPVLPRPHLRPSPPGSPARGRPGCRRCAPDPPTAGPGRG